MPMLIALMGCGKPQPKTPLESLLQRTCLKERVLVEFVTPIDPLSLLLTLHQDGRVSHDGKTLSLDGVRKLTTGPQRDLEERTKVNTSPVLIEAHSDAGLRPLCDLLAVLIEKNRCNIALLAETSRGLGGVSIPVKMCHCCRALWVYDSAWCLDEHGKWECPRTWLRVTIKEGGGIGVLGFHRGASGDEVYYPVKGQPPERGPEEKILEAIKPQLPSWDAKSVGQFFKNPPIAKDDPRIIIDPPLNLTISDFLKGISSLRAAAGEHAVLGCVMWGGTTEKPGLKQDVKK